MSDKTKIEWTDATINPIRARRKNDGRTGYHCEKVSEGCFNCYANTWNQRGMPNTGTGLAYTVPNREKVEIYLKEDVLEQVLRWKRPRRIFVCSMTDLFADFVSDEMIDRVFAVMALAQQHTFQVLTKRPSRMREYLQDISLARCDGRGEALHSFDSTYPLESIPWPLPNVWLGFSAENQTTFDERWEHVAPLAYHGWLTWCSAEPLLGPMDIGHAVPSPDGFVYMGEEYGPVHEFDGGRPISWVVVGGESGPNARPILPDWVRSLRDQCQAVEVPFLFKQWGNYAPPQTAEDIQSFRQGVGYWGQLKSSGVFEPGGKWGYPDG